MSFVCTSVSFVSTTAFWQLVVEIALPVALGALGVLISSRSGYLNVGAEGVMLLGALMGAAGAVWTGSVWLGVLLAAAAGIMANWLVALAAIVGRMGDVLAGITFDIAMIGLTAFLAAQLFPEGIFLGEQSLDSAKLLGENPLVYTTLALAIVTGLLLRKTRLGLRIRAAGDAAEAATVLGVKVRRVRLSVAAASGAAIGVGGAVLSLGVVGTFVTNMTAGRGFVAIAVVYLGAWRPLGVLIASALFGMADAFQFFTTQQSGDWGQLASVLPYVLTVLFAAVAWSRARGPAEESANVEPRLE